MVDRYNSMIGSELLRHDPSRQARPDDFANINRDIVQRTNNHVDRMRECISKYKKNITRDAEEHVEQFKVEQRELARDRNALKGELDRLEGERKKDTPEYNFMKKELLRAVKNEIDLDLELNQEVTSRKEKKEKFKNSLMQGSAQIANALRDIEAKKEEILYLQRQIDECIKLLQIIGVLTQEQGEKIDQVAERVRMANRDIERAEVNIEKAKIASEKSRCKMCIIIVLAIVIIAIIVAVLYGVDIIK